MAFKFLKDAAKVELLPPSLRRIHRLGGGWTDGRMDSQLLKPSSADFYLMEEVTGSKMCHEESLTIWLLWHEIRKLYKKNLARFKGTKDKIKT